MYSPEIPLMSHDLSFFLEGGGDYERPPCHSLKMSLLGQGMWVKGKSDNVTLFGFFFFDGVPQVIKKCCYGGSGAPIQIFHIFLGGSAYFGGYYEDNIPFYFFYGIPKGFQCLKIRTLFLRQHHTSSVEYKILG